MLLKMHFFEALTEDHRLTSNLALHVTVSYWLGPLHLGCCLRLAFLRASDQKKKAHERTSKTIVTLYFTTYSLKWHLTLSVMVYVQSPSLANLEGLHGYESV